MSDRTLKWILWMVGSLCFLFAAVIVVGCVELPLAVPDDRLHVAAPIQFRSSESEAKRSLDETDFRSVWAKSLQRPLVDPPAKEADDAVSKPEKVVVVKVPFEAELLGTLVDADSSFARAWIQWKGNRRMVVHGEVLPDHPDKPKIAKIGNREIIVDVADDVVKLTMTETLVHWESDRAD